jgi:hypothetical protein
MEETKLYKISPQHKKSVYQMERWANQLSNGKSVVLEITTYFRYGDFEIELTEKEKNDILEKEWIVLNDYNATCYEMWDGCEMYQEIPNEDKMSKEEKREMHNLMYKDNEDPDLYDDKCDDYVNEDILEANGWSIDDTIYGISCKCEVGEA